MTTKDTGFFSQILTKYLPLFAIFCLGSSALLIPFDGIGWWEFSYATMYFALLYFYSKAAKKEIGPLFLATLVGAAIVAVGEYFTVYAGASPAPVVGAIVVAFIYLWFISHKKWV